MYTTGMAVMATIGGSLLLGYISSGVYVEWKAYVDEEDVDFPVIKHIIRWMPYPLDDYTMTLLILILGLLLSILIWPAVLVAGLVWAVATVARNHKRLYKLNKLIEDSKDAD